MAAQKARLSRENRDWVEEEKKIFSEVQELGER
jgi:hypothetical protein